MKPALASAQSSRVTVAISMMVGMPRPSSPTRTPQASLNSTSLLELERLPTLSFRRWMWIGFLLPSGRQRGTKKHEGPCSSVLASTRWPSHIGAEKNHLWPVMRNSSPHGPLPAGTARVVLLRTSLPPCFSVMPMPTVMEVLRSSGMSRASCSFDASLSRSAAYSAALRRITGMQALVMVVGQVEPDSIWLCMYSEAP
jgi:lambda repressor-like predicted transcriptional regulator